MFYLRAKVDRHAGYTPSRVAVIEEEELEAQEHSEEFLLPPVIQVTSSKAQKLLALGKIFMNVMHAFMSLLLCKSGHQAQHYDCLLVILTNALTSLLNLQLRRTCL